MAEGRGRLSFWDTLPEWAEPVRLWAAEELNDSKLTQLEILDEVNNRLRAAAWEQGITDPPQASRSSLNRLAMKLAAISKRMRDSRAMFEGMSSQLDHQSVDESAVVLGEFLKTLILELNAEGAAATPKAAMELARAYQAVIQGQKISSDRRRTLDQDYEEKTAQVIDKVASEAGLSAERVAQLRRDFLGVRPKQPEAVDAPVG
mgnify:CR=1 FL=1